MHPNSYIPGGDPNLEELLRQSFLDLDQNNPANDQLFDSTSQNVFGKEWPGQINAQKEAQLLQTKTSHKWVWYMASVLVVGVITTSVILYTKSSKNITADNNKNIVSNENNTTLNSITKNSPLTSNNTTSNEKQENNTAQNNASAEEIKTNSLGVQSGKQYPIVQLKNNNNSKITGIDPLLKSLVGAGNFDTVLTLENSSLVSSETFVSEIKEPSLPFLDAAKIEETRKEKSRMIEEATTKLALFYAHVSPSSKSGYNNKTFQAPFNLKTTEVTVREYKVFLNDLIINNKREEYEKAKPKYEEMFKDNPNSADKKFFDKYFTLSTYKNYPVVFITSEGAQLYCNWLQESIVSIAQGKFSKVSVNLPNESEWERAALGGKANHKYATAGGKIKQLFGDYKANFRATQQNDFSFVNTETSDEIAGEDVDSTMKSENPKKKIKTEKIKTEKNSFTCDVKMYGPNENGIYNMSGNVSEMVFDKNRKVIAKGGNWNSAVEFLQIKDFNEFMFVSASPYIGFRPLITFK